MKNKYGETIKTLTIKYETFTDFDFVEILSEYNEKNQTNYTLDDISDDEDLHWVKWGTLYLKMKDGNIIKHEGSLIDIDTKRPDDYQFYG